MNECSYIEKKKKMKKKKKNDVDCAACADKMELAAKDTAGVKNANVNFMMLQMKVEFENGADTQATMSQVRRNCKRVEDDCEVFI